MVLKASILYASNQYQPCICLLDIESKKPTLGRIVPNSDKYRAPFTPKTRGRISVPFIISDISLDCIKLPFAAIRQDVGMLSPITNCIATLAFIFMSYHTGNLNSDATFDSDHSYTCPIVFQTVIVLISSSCRHNDIPLERHNIQ